MIRIRIASVSLLLTPIAWMASASALLCCFLGRLDLFRFPYVQWAQAAPWWRLSWRMTLSVVASAAIPTVAVLALCGVAWRLWRRRRTRPLYGETHPATPAEMVRGGLVIRRAE